MLTRSFQFISAILPPGNDNKVATAYQFFSAWLTIPVILFFWAVGYAWKREGGIRIDQIDVDTGRRALDWDAINAYRAEVAAMPKWRRTLHKLY
jgi:amino acid transporter